MENHCAIDNETSTGALMVLHYKRCAKNREMDSAFEHDVANIYDAHPSMRLLIKLS